MLKRIISHLILLSCIYFLGSSTDEVSLAIFTCIVNKKYVLGCLIIIQN